MDNKKLQKLLEEEKAETHEEITPIKFVKDRKKAIQEMIDIFSVQSPSGKEFAMQTFLKKELNKHLVSYTQDYYGNILVTKGKLEEGEYYPCVVAHMDKVHSFRSKYKVLEGTLTDTDEPILWATAKSKFGIKTEEAGGCGDDGAGIYVALEALKHFDKIKLVFTVEEEIGCIGASRLDLDFFKDCGYLLQGDRKGSSDLIIDYFYSRVCSKDFLEKGAPIFEKFGFKEDSGSMTDVMELAEKGVDISVLNFSVGYYDAHFKSEYTKIDELLNSTEFCMNLITHLGNKIYSHKYESYISYKYDHGKYDHIYGYGHEDDIEGYHDYSSWYMDRYGGFPTEEDDDEDCICTELHNFLGTVDPHCPTCNSFNAKSDFFCDCGNSLDDRRYSLNCPICGKIFIKA
jgi:hypothetical protein